MECNKHFSSKANYYIHKREKHTYYNCKTILCDFCKKEFNSPRFNKERYYTKCVYIQNLLRTNDLKSGTYVYKDEYKYYLDTGKYI